MIISVAGKISVVILMCAYDVYHWDRANKYVNLFRNQDFQSKRK